MVIVSRNLERTIENDGFKMTALATNDQKYATGNRDRSLLEKRVLEGVLEMINSSC